MSAYVIRSGDRAAFLAGLRELIDFLAQLEEFQKKLWLKKKFVISSHYCITLDRVPEALYPAIVGNPRQWEQWRQLGLWTGAANGTEQDLRNAPFRMLDTSLYDAAFKARLLASIADLDGSVNGTFVHSDNFQALSFLQERYREQVMDGFRVPPPAGFEEQSKRYQQEILK